MPSTQVRLKFKRVSFLKLLQKQITVARLFGIPVRIDYRWFLIFVITTWLMAENISARVAFLGQNWALALGIASTLAYFVSILGHELSHALAARLEGIQTTEIVLHPFGGLARLSREPDSPRSEFRIGIAGPVASFLFAALFFLLAVFIDSFTRRMTGFSQVVVHAAATSFFLIGFGNLLLAVFNLFPGYPLDGGRVLRAFLWRRNGDMNRSTMTAGRVGQVIAIALGAIGIFLAVVRHDLFTGLWTVLVGVFLFDAALKIVSYSRRLDQVTAGDAMIPSQLIEPELLVSQLIDNVLPLHRQSTFLVAHDRRLHGIVTLADLRAIPRERWYRLRVDQVMRPVTPELFVARSMDLRRAISLAKGNGVGVVAVLDPTGAIAGVVMDGTVRKK